ncbi:MAG: hypothetical protein KJ623_00530 [Nanoarchaeota archaeon]|nr:hypothetical protein [Nanoarchaeota archaeon]
MKKAQTEMMGLVILVLLISLAGIFAIRFLLSSNTEVGPEIKLQTQAENMQTSFLKLNIDGRSMSDLFSDCCMNNDCNFLSSTFPNLMNLTLPGQNYELVLSTNSKSCYETLKKCTKKVASNGIISGNNQVYSLQLSLCY